MEDTGFTPDQVHVLRQTFRPNEPLHTALSELVTTETARSRPFTIYGTDERIVELHDINTRAFNVQKREADAYMHKHHTARLQLEGEVNARILKTISKGAVALQLIMQPEDIRAFAHIREALDIVSLGRPSRAIGFEATRLYTNIPVENLRPLPEVRRGLEGINDTLRDSTTHRLYQLIPETHLVGQFMSRPRPELLELHNPEEAGK